MKKLAPLNLVPLAIAEGATTPVPGQGAGAILYSTTLSRIVVWTGSQWTAGSGGGGTGGSITVSATPPASPSAGASWIDTTSGIEYVYVDDGDTSQWVEFGPGGSGSNGTSGTSASLALGTISTLAAGSAATWSNSGTSTNAIINIGVPRGDKGDAATITLGAISTGAPGSQAAFSNTGNANNMILNLTIPTGQDGAAATVAIGTVTTLAAGSNATVTNAGTAAAAILNFGIPQGQSTITTQKASLTADVTMTTAGTFYDGPALTLAVGTYLVYGTIQVSGGTNAALRVVGKLWDGTTAYHGAESSCPAMGASTKGWIELRVFSVITVLSGTLTVKLSAASSLASSIFASVTTDYNTGLQNNVTTITAVKIA